MNRTALDQYEGLVTDALKSCSAKLRKSFKTAFIQLMILYMVLPRKINFTQMGRYSDSSEQRFRQLFEREFDWMQFNLFLMRQRFGESVRKAIAIDASYISKSGKKTPYIGKFWSGCASQVKRGLEILGIGIIDIDSRDVHRQMVHGINEAIGSSVQTVYHKLSYIDAAMGEADIRKMFKTSNQLSLALGDTGESNVHALDDVLQFVAGDFRMDPPSWRSYIGNDARKTNRTSIYSIFSIIIIAQQFSSYFGYPIHRTRTLNRILRRFYMRCSFSKRTDRTRSKHCAAIFTCHFQHIP